MKKIAFLFLAVFPLFVSGQNLSHKIKVIINGYPDSTLYLAYYYGNKVKLADTAVSHTKTFVFNGKQNLKGGIYIVVSQQKSKLFEFVLNKKQSFTLKTDTVNYSLDLTPSGSKENRLFYSYLKHNEAVYKKIKLLSDSLKKMDANSDEATALRKEVKELTEEGKAFKLKMIEDNHGTFVATLLTAMREVEIPDSVKNSTDSTASFYYYKNHFWDYFPLNDDRLLRTPLFDKRIKEYFKNLVVLNADSVITAIDHVISRAEPNEDVVSYLVWYFTSEYQNPKYMGFDKILVHLVDNYFSKREIEYTTPSVLESLQKRANVLRKLLIGQEAPNLIVIDTAGNYQSFLSMPNDYTILLFWDYDCSICKREIKALKKVMAEHPPYDIGIFAVNTNSNLKKWKQTIHDRHLESWTNVNGTRSVTKDFHDIYDINGTPVLYLLDKDKHIIAKKLKADKLVLFLNHYTQTKK
jgi:peroxiredoxin